MNGQSPTEFERDLRRLINQHSTENHSNTPDFVLANFLIRCLEAWTAATKARDSWFGFSPWKPKEAQPPDES